MVLWHVTLCLLLVELDHMAISKPRYSHRPNSKPETVERPLSLALEYMIGVAAEIEQITE